MCAWFLRMCCHNEHHRLNSWSIRQVKHLKAVMSGTLYRQQQRAVCRDALGRGLTSSIFKATTKKSFTKPRHTRQAQPGPTRWSRSLHTLDIGAMPFFILSTTNQPQWAGLSRESLVCAAARLVGAGIAIVKALM